MQSTRLGSLDYSAAKSGGSSPAACAFVFAEAGPDPRATLAEGGTDDDLRSIGAMHGHSR